MPSQDRPQQVSCSEGIFVAPIPAPRSLCRSIAQHRGEPLEAVLQGLWLQRRKHSLANHSPYLLLGLGRDLSGRQRVAAGGGELGYCLVRAIAQLDRQ